MDTIWNIVEATPWWVWALFIYLLFKGYKATRNQTTHLYRLMITPIIFVVLSLHTLVTLPLDFMKVLSYIIATLVGVSFGFWQISRLFLQVDKKRKLIHTPGSWTPFILIFLVFGSKYYFGYSLALDPQLSTHAFFVFPLLLVSGACAGMFIGRTACYICRYLSLPHQSLVEDD